MTVSNRGILSILNAYLERYPVDVSLRLSEPMRLLSQEGDLTSRRAWPMHVTVGALLVRGTEILLVSHRAYGILLQTGGHVEPADVTLPGAALRELTEETGISRSTVLCVSRLPVYAENARVPARPVKDEPEHFHLGLCYAFTTSDGDIGRIQESEVTAAGWYPLDEAGRLVGTRVQRAMSMPPDQPGRSDAVL